MSRVLPILFNGAMVSAILDGRKTVTRRLVKHDVDAILNSPYHKEHPEVEDKQIISKLCLPPYQPGDTMYVRETWSEWTDGYLYKAWTSPFPQPGESALMKWHPSIHMPKEAARIWLKVKDVRVERLQEITPAQAKQEGVGDLFYEEIGYDDKNYGNPVDEKYGIAKEQFAWLWDSTIKKSELDRYGWDANPWVWVIEFERCEKPEEI